MPGRFLEIPVFLGDCFIMPHPVDYRTYKNNFDSASKMKLLCQYYVNYDVEVLQSTCGIRRATSCMLLG